MEKQIDVKALRAALNLTQAGLAEAVGVDQSTVSNWEKGKPPRGPALKMLVHLAENAPSVPPEVFRSPQRSGARTPSRVPASNGAA